MERKTIAQEYYALVTDKNGNMPPLRAEESKAGLVAAGLLDLLLGGVVAVEAKKASVPGQQALPKELAPLAPLYAYLAERPRTMERVMQDYSSEARARQLIASVGEGLLADGAASLGKGGLFGPGKTYVVEERYKQEVAGALKTAVMGKAPLSPHDRALLCSLKESRNLGRYFSQEEQQYLKARLRETECCPQNRQMAAMIHSVQDTAAVLAACVLTYSV